jgi:hypothetical protein
VRIKRIGLAFVVAAVAAATAVIVASSLSTGSGTQASGTTPTTTTTPEFTITYAVGGSPGCQSSPDPRNPTHGTVDCFYVNPAKGVNAQDPEFESKVRNAECALEPGAAAAHNPECKPSFTFPPKQPAD